MVISAIAVLMGLLFPVVKIVRSSSKSIRCSSCLSQLFLACESYSRDWDGYYPRLKYPVASLPSNAYLWFNAISSLVGHESDDCNSIMMSRRSSVIWGCPEWNPDPASIMSTRPGFGQVWYYNSYGSNASSNFVDYPTSAIDCSSSSVSFRSRRIMLGDARDHHLYFAYGANGGKADYHSVWDPVRHGGKGANYAFFDGHIQMVTAASNAYLGSSMPDSSDWRP